MVPVGDGRRRRVHIQMRIFNEIAKTEMILLPGGWACVCVCAPVWLIKY